MLTGHGKQSGCSPIQDPALVDVHHTGYYYLQLGDHSISKPTKNFSGLYQLVPAGTSPKSWESCKSESQVKKFRVYLKILAEVKEG